MFDGAKIQLFIDYRVKKVYFSQEVCFRASCDLYTAFDFRHTINKKELR